MTKKALIAGWGQLPRLWAERAAAQAEDFIVIRIAEEITAEFSDLDCAEYTVNLTQLGEILQLLEDEEIEEAIWLGKIQKAHLFNDFNPDQKLKQLLTQLPDLNDDTILMGLALEFINSGVKILPQTYLLEDQLAEPGILAGEVDSELKRDLIFAFETAYNLGRFDIGQTALVKDGAVMALEAIEGTDEAIKRAAKFGGPGVVMAKCSKKNQDIRFDLPTVGLKTLENLIEAEAGALIIEADKTFILNKEEFCRRAAAEGIVIAAAEYNKEELILPWQK
ncbi:LpxI family protein [Halanaerobium saccharolyticum]|uniref:LpxI family protein n=1 Tax=Halanaerobium saccharolyticum TaxID=43595 RepID=UPI003FCD85DD